MLNLFQSIFRPGADKLGGYPEDLIERAVERAVDGTDRRLRALSGYKKALRPAVIRALDHVVQMVDSLPPPLELDHRNYGTDAELGAYFSSVDQIKQVLSRDAELRQWRKSPGSAAAQRIIMLLMMEMSERNVLGMALEGDTLRHDVALQTVSFTKHRMVDPTTVEDDTRRLLKRRAFDHLLTLALATIAEAHGERADLERERTLLRGKLAALAEGHWGFGGDGGGEADEPADPQGVEQRIKTIDSQLSSLSTGLLQSHLEILADVLTRAEQNLCSERVSLCIDRQGVKQANPGGRAPEIMLDRLHNTVGRSIIVRMVGIAGADLPPPPDFLREAQRFLG